MASPAEGASSPVSDMDFDSPPLPSNKEKEDAHQDQGAVAEDVQRKSNEMVSKGDDQPDARLSVKSAYDLDISMDDLTVTDVQGKKFPLHRSKETQLEHCFLGGGSFGDVFRVNHAIYGVVAVKRAKPGKGDHIKMYQKEIEKHVKSLTSEQIVSIKGFVQCEDVGCNCGLVGFVMKYMENGSLWDFRIKKWKDSPEFWPLTNKMVYQISLGMHFLHSKDIIHRDLKLENVLIDGQLNVKIADLGLATNLNTSSGDKCWGTDSHKPPEAFRTDLPSNTKVVTPKYDVYSFSMTLYQLLTGIHPYSDRGIDMIILLKVEAKQTPSLQPIPENATQELIEILKESWSYEACDRPEFRDIIDRVDKLDTDRNNKSLGSFLNKLSLGGVLPRLENLTLNDHAAANAHGSKRGTSPAPTTEEILESSTQSRSAICGPNGKVWHVTPSQPPVTPEVIAPLESSQTQTFGGRWISGQENGSQDNFQSQTAAQRSTGFRGLVNPSAEDIPRQSGIAPLRSDAGHEREPGKWSESAVWNKQETFSPEGQTPSRYGPGRPDVSGGKTLHSRSGDRRPVPVDSQYGRTEFAVGSTEGGTTYMPIHQESPPVAPPQPSSPQRDPTIVFDSASMSDQDFDIKLKVRLTVPIRASISSKLDQILSSLERCKQRDYWPLTNNSLCTMFLSHEFTLRTLELPPTVDEDQFTLFLCVSDKSALEKLHKLSHRGLLPSLLFPLFVDRHLEDICRPVKPDVKVDQWDDQFNRGMEHFKKKEKSEGSRQSESEHSESKNRHSKETTPNITFTQKDCKGATQISTGKVNITMNSGPKNMIVGDQHNTYYYYNGTKGRGGGGAAGGRRGRGAEGTSQSQPQNKKATKPKLSESTQKVNETTLMDAVDNIPGDTVKSLGRHLGLTAVEVDNIVYEHRYERSSEQAYQVLLEWKQRRGQQATKKVLANALWEAKCYDAARNVR